MKTKLHEHSANLNIFKTRSYVEAVNTHRRGRITVWLGTSLTRLELTKIEDVWLLVCSEAVKYKLVKLKSSCIVMLPPMGTVL